MLVKIGVVVVLLVALACTIFIRRERPQSNSESVSRAVRDIRACSSIRLKLDHAKRHVGSLGMDTIWEEYSQGRLSTQNDDDAMLLVAAAMYGDRRCVPLLDEIAKNNSAVGHFAEVMRQSMQAREQRK